MNRVTLYFDQLSKVQATFLEGRRRNLPMFSPDLKIYRGIDNNILVEIKDSDRLPVSIHDGQLRCVIVDPYEQKLKLVRYLSYTEGQNNSYTIPLTSGDIQHWSAGFYQYSVILTDDNGLEIPLYTTLDQEVTGRFELIDKPYPAQVLSRKIEPSDFTITNLNNIAQPFSNTFTTSRYPGDGQKNINDSMHSISISMTEFNGTFYVQGSLEETPLNDNDWFNIKVDPENPNNDFIEFDDVTGIYHYDFVGNYVWVRFQYIVEASDHGSIDRIYYKF